MTPTMDLKLINGVLHQKWEKKFRTMSEVTWYYDLPEEKREPREEWRPIPSETT